MRLSEFAQDVLLSVIYRLEDVEDKPELTTLELEILESAKKYDRNQPQNQPLKEKAVSEIISDTPPSNGL